MSDPIISPLSEEVVKNHKEDEAKEIKDKALLVAMMKEMGATEIMVIGRITVRNKPHMFMLSTVDPGEPTHKLLCGAHNRWHDMHPGLSEDMLEI